MSTNRCEEADHPRQDSKLLAVSESSEPGSLLRALLYKPDRLCRPVT